MVLDKIREKQAQRLQTALRTPSPPPLPLNQRTPQGPASIVKHGQKLDRGKIDPEQIQRFSRGSIASTDTLVLASQVLKAAQEATNAHAKRASLGGQVAQRGGTIKVSECRAICSKRKENEEEQARKRKDSEESGRRNRQILSWAQVGVFISGAPSVDKYLSYISSSKLCNSELFW